MTDMLGDAGVASGLCVSAVAGLAEFAIQMITISL